MGRRVERIRVKGQVDIVFACEGGSDEETRR